MATQNPTPAEGKHKNMRGKRYKSNSALDTTPWQPTEQCIEENGHNPRDKNESNSDL